MVRFLSVYSSIEDNHISHFLSTPQYTREYMSNSRWHSLHSHSIQADSDYTLRDLLVSGVKRYRPNKIASDWFDFVRLARLVRKSNSQQNRCSILFDCRTQLNNNRSIEFDWIFVRFCSIRYPGFDKIITPSLVAPSYFLGDPLLAPVFRRVDATLWINHYPMRDNSIGFASVYPPDSDLSGW